MKSSSNIIRLAVLDDHPIIRRSINIVMESVPDINVVGSFGHSRDLYQWLRKENCDVLILDYILQNDELDGLALIRQLLVHNPSLKILMASSMETMAVIRTAFIYGIKGYVAKREEASVYLCAIRTIAGGQRYIPSNIASELTQLLTSKRDGDLSMEARNDDFSSLKKLLTPREAEVIYYFLEGISIIDISAKLKRSRKTVSGHKQTAMRKLGVCSDLELFKYRNDLFK